MRNVGFQGACRAGSILLAVGSLLLGFQVGRFVQMDQVRAFSSGPDEIQIHLIIIDEKTLLAIAAMTGALTLNSCISLALWGADEVRQWKTVITQRSGKPVRPSRRA